MPNTILFDLDGTLTNPEQGITLSVAYALEHFGIHVEDTSSLRKFIGPPLQDSFMDFYGFSPEKTEAAIAKYRERFSTTGIFENIPYEGIHSLLSQLCSEGYRLAVASSKPEVFTRRIVEHFEMSPFFSAICGSELDGRRSDKAEVIAYALDTLGSPAPDSVLMVGDRKHDIIGAKKNGLHSIGVLFGFGDEEELRSAGADFLAASPEEIHEIIRTLP